MRKKRAQLNRIRNFYLPWVMVVEASTMKTADLREIEIDFYNRCRCEYFDAIFFGVLKLFKKNLYCVFSENAYF